MKKRLLLCFIGIALVFVIWIANRRFPNIRFFHGYENLMIGMTMDRVIETFGGLSPSGSWRYGEFVIWYFERPSNSFEGTKPLQIPPEVSIKSLRELPDRYASVQVVFDHQKQLWAHSWIGETHDVVYHDGRIRGSNVIVLEAQMDQWGKSETRK